MKPGRLRRLVARLGASLKIPTVTVIPVRTVAVLCALCLGTTALACAAIARATAPETPIEFANPVVVRNSLDMAVVKIPARKGELLAECTLVIDYRVRSWALSC